jgi:hypothetical protein
VIARLRERRQLTKRMKHAGNPRRLSRQQWEAEEAAQVAVLIQLLRDEDDGPDEFEVRRARAEAARREHYAPGPSRDQQAALMQYDLVQQVNRGR